MREWDRDYPGTSKVWIGVFSTPLAHLTKKLVHLELEAQCAFMPRYTCSCERVHLEKFIFWGSPEIVFYQKIAPIVIYQMAVRSSLLDESAAAFHQMKLDQSYKSVGSSTSFHIDTLFAPIVAGQVLGDRNDPQPKMWAIMTLKNPVAASQTPEKVADTIWQDCEIELMYLCPGDFFFQPPGAVHLVYTPRACVASGGHFYNYDSLHLTEWTRRIQHLQFNAVTNQDPAHVKEVLNMMMLNFPNKLGRCFYRHALAALCQMVLAENEYIHQQQAKLKVGNKLDQKAEAMAEIVTCVCFEISLAPGDERKVTVDALVKILEGDYQEPGMAFRLEPETVQTIEEFTVKYWEAFSTKKKKTTKKG
ncbi:hypothetical protein DFH05DRAFT_1455388 [Lentinula detonsa]|uniref:JmjC domain-containing protein n=1 Tax=Lentinula detonsa TaxID=2804962 RepID=A0A9W8U2Z3_9AGAR|nr:hypothetical protein DFH05DRAFT_1455388 [Lentinula detonsa]